MRTLCLFLFASLLAVTHCARNLSAIYRFSSQLKGDDYVVHWNFDTDTRNISFAVRVRTTGWIGFGLSPNGQMPNSDVIVGWVDTNGQATIHDRFARGRFTPPIDSEQNWFLIRGEEDGDFTTLEFWRNFTTCDSDNDRNLMADTARVIWSYDTVDPTDPTGSIPRHQFQGTRSINFFSGTPTARSTPADSNSFQIRNTNYTVPNDETTYYCSLHYLHDIIKDIDTSQEKIYFYKVAPLIPPENLPYVHHQLVFLCPINTQLAESGPCGNVFFGCFGGQIIAAWAVGGESFEMPEGIGFPLGGLNQPFLILLEVHYDNPNGVQDLVDSSGMEFFYTKMAPTHEAGGISISFPVGPLLVVPPRVERFDYTVFCLGSCMERHLPDDGITVFASFLHTHLIGTGLVVRHYRPTTSVTADSQCSAMEELAPIDQNMLYDFDYQQFNNLQRNVQVKKGDTLAVQCFYNSMNRSGVTLGGESTREEMCQTLLYYYPRIPLVTCATFPDPNITHRNFFVKYFSNDTESVDSATDALNGDHYAGVTQAFNNITWNTTSVNDLKQFIESAPVQLAVCAEDGVAYVVNNTIEPKVQVDCPYVPPNECTCFTPPTCCQRVAGAPINRDAMCPVDNSTLAPTTTSSSTSSPTSPSAASHLTAAGILLSLLALLLTVFL